MISKSLALKVLNEGLSTGADLLKFILKKPTPIPLKWTMAK